MAAPLLQQSLPSDNATGVSVTSNIGLGFDQAVKAGSGFIRIYKSDGTLFHTIAITDTSQVTFSTTQPARVMINPNVDLVAGTGYYILIDAGAIENAGGEDYAGISSATALNFTTAGTAPGDTIAPLLNTTTPADDATGVAVGSNLVLTFNEAVKAGTGLIVIHNALDGSTARIISASDTSQVSFSGSQLTINPTTDLAENHAYYVTLTSDAVRDLANNNFAGISSSTAFNFTTAGTADTTAPILTNTSPADNAISVAPGADIVLTFNEAVQAGFGNVIIRYSANDVIATTIQAADDGQVHFSGNQVTIDPIIDLMNDMSYYVTIDNGAVRDVAGNSYLGLSGATTFNFTITSDSTAPLLIDTYPDDNATDVDPSANLVLVFDDEVKAGSGNIEIRRASDNSLVESISITDAVRVTFYDNQVTIDPSSNLEYDESYYVTMASGVVLDDADNAFAGISSSTTFSFSVPPDTWAPLLVDTSPADDSTAVDVGTNIVLTFNEAVKAGSGNIEIRKTSDGTIAKTIAITDTSQINFSGNQLTIAPSSDLADDTSYYVTFGSGVVLDLSNNAFEGISSSTALNFSTPPHFVTGTSGPDALLGDEDRNDIIDGLTGVDTLTGKSGDDTYIIENYEGGETSILLLSSPGDFIGDGEVWSALPDADELAWNLVDFSGDGVVDLLTLYYWHDQSEVWVFEFTTRNIGVNLAPGTYLDAERFGNATPGHPEFSVVLGGSTASQLYGNFTIHNATFDYSGDEPELVSFSITFEAHGGTPGAPPLYGTLNYNYAPAGPAVIDQIIEDPDGGTDKVLASISYVLPDNVENLTLTGDDDLDGTGNDLSNFITGNTGNNILDGAGDADTMEGSYGDDTYIVDNVGDSIVELSGQGIDIVQSSVTHELDPHVENLTLTGTGDVDGSGNGLDNILIGNAGANALSGGAGDDRYIVGAGDSVVEDADAGTDTVESSVTYVLEENVENLTLTGTGNINGTGNGLDNVLLGSQLLPDGGGQNVLTGGAGNDTLNGRTGLDTLVGGVGDDTYIIENYEGGGTSVLLQSEPGDYIGLGQTLSYLGNIEFLYVQDGTGDGIVDNVHFRYADPDYRHWWYFTFSTTELDTNLVPGTYLDARDNEPDYAGLDVYGDGRGDESIGSFTVHNAVFDYSGPEPVVISLSISFEQHVGTLDAPALYGRINYNYSAAGPVLTDSIVEGDGEGIDTVMSAVSYALAANVENLTLTDVNDISGTGNELNNTIIGNDGHNILDGGAGADAMEGREGDDTYILDNVGDTVLEDLSYGGNDTVVSPFTYTLGAYVENLTLTGSANLNGTGNGLSNTLTGNTGANILTGGLGDDTYVVDTSDTFIENANEGNDTVKVDFTYTLATNFENLTLLGSGNINGTGNASGNVLVGNSGNNVLDGGPGNDWMLGGEGDDTFRVVAGAGNDTIEGFSPGVGAGDVVVLDGFSFDNFNEVLAAMSPWFGLGTSLNLGNGQTLVFYDVQKTAFTADDFSLVNIQLSGPEPFTLPISGAFTNTINGTRRADNLTGTAANNKLDGGRGNDTMTGLAGDDTYVVDASGDVVVESSGNGIDTVIASASSYALANEVENLTLTGTSNHTATGNGLNNLIIASNRPDAINGGAGNDIIRAGTGACVLTGGSGNDMFDFDFMGSLKTITDFQVGEDLVDLRTLLTWYGGSSPVADNVIALSAVAGGVLVSVKASAGGSLQSLVKLTGISVGDVDVGGDILWDA